MNSPIGSDTSAAIDKVELTPAARHLLKSLPSDVRVVEAACRFPHVINRLGEHWREPELLERALFELTLDERGTRRGFPMAVLTELAVLREHILRKRLGRTKIYELVCHSDGSLKGKWRVIERSAECSTALIAASEVIFSDRTTMRASVGLGCHDSAESALEVYLDGRRVFE